MWAISSNSFDDLPYDLLLSCLKHPYLTIDSEKSLSDALLNWLAASEERKSNWTDMLKQPLTHYVCPVYRFALAFSHYGLPLYYQNFLLVGKRSCSYFSKFADESINAILALVNHPFTGSVNSLGDDDLSHLRLRLTKYTKRVDVSGCPQITPVIMLLSILPCSYSSYQILKKKLKQYSMSRERLAGDNFQISWGLWPALTFEAVQELDITNCPMLNLEAAIECFCKSFPSLRVLKAAYFLNFRVTKLQQLVGRLPLLCDVDLTVDISPVRPTKMSILSSLPVTAPRISASSLGIDSCPSVATLSCISRPLLSNLTRLTLEGRTDVGDFELKKVTELCVSLCYLNLKGCTSMTDAGIADLILRCVKLHSIVICDTSFGQHSVMALCSSKPNFDHSAAPQINEDSHSLAYKLQTLHIGGCTGVNEDSLTQLLSQVHLLKSLCLRETQLVDNGLYNFLGFSLEMLDVSNTKVSTAALAHVAERNAGLKCLKARGCRNFLKQDKTEGEASTSPHASKELYLALRRSCKLEEVAIGWGSSCFSIETLKPAITMLRAITVGLGGSLGQDGLKLLAASCPLLESVILYFQVISDAILMDMLKSFIHLQVLALCYCLGEISSLCFQVNMPFLRKLRLERVTPWMTNDDLVILTQSAANLVELTLLGCSLLNSGQWLDCGKVTTNGVTSLLQCQALEDILLRHNGSGLQRDFILDAASKLPMLRKVSLDVCDAKDGDFDIPNFADRYFLSTVKIARCKHQRCTFDLQNMEARRAPVHKETLVMVWDSRNLTHTVVKERL
ncbi:hypothetical protein RJ639_002145 [Escallonia herrerae]|uniref:BACK domain-containing protein n=1 Tax=Escallonia herrerae TaxID=1293975 RepID=A0AA88XBB1_9ASTE|nr:hypothetical protein RJ639_002145 [Escallonia herrerae]